MDIYLDVNNVEENDQFELNVDYYKDYEVE